jgi:hypothetical protein
MHDIIVLPRYYVTDSRVKLTDKELLTDKGMTEMAEKKCLSPAYRYAAGPLSQLAAYYFSPLSILHGWHPNEAEAVLLYRQEERLEMLSQMDALMRLEKISDEQEAKQIEQLRSSAALSSRGAFIYVDPR